MAVPSKFYSSYYNITASPSKRKEAAPPLPIDPQPASQARGIYKFRTEDGLVQGFPFHGRFRFPVDRDLHFVGSRVFRQGKNDGLDRKSTRLNSSHVKISYAVFCLKKKK